MTCTFHTSAAPVALIEIGSNQVWIIIGHYTQQQLHITHEVSATLRLGGCLTAQGELATPALESLLQQLQDWKPLWESCPPQRRHMVGTQVLRDARNRAACTHALQAAVQGKLHIIDGRQEAAWGYAGAMHKHTGTAHAPCLVLDIGGRSTEVSYGRGPQFQRGESFELGAVSWSQRYFTQGLTATAFEQALSAAHMQLAALRHPVWQQAWAHIYGVAGVAHALTHVLQQLGHPNNTLTLAALTHLQTQLCEQGMAWLYAHCQLPPGLEPMLGGCISTMRALMEVLAISQLQMTSGGLRHGALLAYAQQHATHHRT